MIFFVIARAESPLRSTGFQKAKRTCPYASITCSGLPRQSLAFLPRNDMVCCPRTVHNPYFVIARAWPVAIHCELISEETSLNAFHETRWIAASDCRPSRNDKMHVVTEPHCPYASIAWSGLPRRTLAFLPRNVQGAQ